VSFDAKGDLCLGFFQAFWDEGLLPELPKGARVLEIGCAEADWLASMREARPDLYLVGIDQRSTGDRKAADEVILADVLTYEFPEASFDAVIAVSMIEWAGCGHYGDPKDEEGDWKTLMLARHWVKPDGWLYFDVPYSASPGDIVNRKHNPDMRIYTDADFAALFETSGWDVVTRRWFEGRLEGGRVHPDGPYMAHLLKPRL
jgi:cyclopropane fatty-acyl-phospholipid synthase-like methyltransferase